jgi:hypothetical protein
MTTILLQYIVLLYCTVVMGSRVKLVVLDTEFVSHIWIRGSNGHCSGIKLKPNEDSLIFTLSLSEVQEIILGSKYEKCILKPKDWDVMYEDNEITTVVKLNWKRAK